MADLSSRAAPVDGTPSGDDATTRWALGASLALLAAALVGLLLGWLAGTRSIGGLYVTFLMPILLGSLIGGAAAFPARRLGFGHKRPLVAAALLGALIAFLAQHVFAFLRFAELLAQQNTSDVLVNDIADPVAAGLMHLERATGEEGWFAYLAFTSRPEVAQASPVGLLARVGLGQTGTLVVASVEFLLLSATAAISVLWRTRALRVLPAPFAVCDDAGLLDAGRALDGGDIPRAATILTTPPERATHALYWDEGGRAIAIHGLDDRGTPLTRRATRQLSPAAAEALARAIAHLGGQDARR